MALLDRRRKPFAVLGGIIVLVSVIVLALPEPGLVQARRNRAFTSDQAGWAYRLLVLAAIAHAAYAGFAPLRPYRAGTRLAAARGNTDDGDLVARLAREAAWMASLTLVYGCVALAVTAERGGFWLFVLIAVAQGLWYYRSVGQTAAWLALAPPNGDPGPRAAGTSMPGDDYVPPVARGLLEGSPPRRT